MRQSLLSPVLLAYRAKHIAEIYQAMHKIMPTPLRTAIQLRREHSIRPFLEATHLPT